MKRIIIKIVFALFIIMLLVSINTKIYATDPFGNAKDFVNEGKQNQTKINFGPISGTLYNILLSIGVVVAVIVATVLGLQFMLGGVEAQVKVKEMLVPFVIGCIVVFGGFGIWKLALTLGDKFESGSTLKNEYIVAYINDNRGGTL